MAKYLRPRRGSQANAIAQKILLKKGEMFLEFPESEIGKGPGRLVIGDGATQYQNMDYATTATNVFRPFITDPEIFIPRFTDTEPSSSEWSVDAGTAAIAKMGNGSSTSTVTLPTIIGAIKETLCKHADSITKLNNDLANIKTTSYIGMIIESTTLNSEDKVIEQYGGERWIEHSGYVLRGASSGVTANSNTKTGGNDSVSYTPAGSNSGMGVTMNAVSLSHSGGAVQNHTLTVSEIPSHTHGYTRLAQPTTGLNLGISAGNNFTQNYSDTSKSTGGGGAHNHGFTQPSAHSFTPTAKSYTQPKFTGTSATINTLPQYKSVYIWERVE